jgi:hypothetical protein
VTPDLPHVDNGHRPEAAPAPAAPAEFTAHFEHPLVEHAPTPEPDRTRVSVETLIFRSGLVSPDELGELAQLHAQTGRTIEELALERGLVSPHALETLLRSQVQPLIAVPEQPIGPTMHAPAPAREPAVTLPDLRASAHMAEFTAPAPEAGLIAPAAPEAEPTATVSAPVAEFTAPAAPEAEPTATAPAPVAEFPASAPMAEFPALAPIPPAASSEPIATYAALPEPEPEETATTTSEPAPVGVLRRDELLAYAVVVYLEGGGRLEDGLFSEHQDARSRSSSLAREFSIQSDSWVAIGASFVRSGSARAVSIEARVINSSIRSVS